MKKPTVIPHVLSDHRSILFVFVFLVSLGAYFLTLAPTFTWANDGMDSAEFALTIRHLGIPHPTGYPIFNLLGKVFSLNPLFKSRDLAFRTNVMSASAGALAVAVLFLVLERITGTALFSVLLAFIFSFSRTFWSQAVITEVYTLNTLFVSAMFYFSFRYMESRDDCFLYSASFMLGLGLCNHGTSVLMAPSYLLLLFWGRKRMNVRKFLFLGLIFLLCASSYLYLPIRASADPVINTGDPSTLKGFFWTLLAEPYQGQMFESSVAGLIRDLRDYPLLNQFSAFLVPIGIIGLWEMAQESGIKTVFLMSSFVSCVLYALNYDIPDVGAYFLMSYVVFILWVGAGINAIEKLVQLKYHFSRIMVTGLAAVFLVTVLVLQISSNYTVIMEPQRKESLSYAEKTFRLIPEDNAVLFSYGAPKNFSLQYYKHEILQGKGCDLVVCGYVIWEWYLEQLKRRGTIEVPEYDLEDMKKWVIRKYNPDTRGRNRMIWRYFLRSEMIARLIRANIRTRPVYMNEMLPILNEYFHFGRINDELYKLSERTLHE